MPRLPLVRTALLLALALAGHAAVATVAVAERGIQTTADLPRFIVGTAERSADGRRNLIHPQKALAAARAKPT